jgi:hypothetical protein
LSASLDTSSLVATPHGVSAAAVGRFESRDPSLLRRRSARRLEGGFRAKAIVDEVDLPRFA